MTVAIGQKAGRGICLALAGVDAVLGLTAAVFPAAYLSIVHPSLPASEYPIDWVARTGAIWLMFLTFEMSGALSAAPGKWFFCVAMVRWMEVPADVVYGVLARGATPLSQAGILAAPVVNAVAGALLLMAFRQQSRLPILPER
jgi:hypothetical protein